MLNIVRQRVLQMIRSLSPSKLPTKCPLTVNTLQIPQQLCQWRGHSETTPQLTDGEKTIVNKLKTHFPGAKQIEVSDISGGCGAMYQISIEAEEFRGKKIMTQHRLVNEVLAEEIKTMHGLQLNTKAPTDS